MIISFVSEKNKLILYIKIIVLGVIEFFIYNLKSLNNRGCWYIEAAIKYLILNSSLNYCNVYTAFIFGKVNNKIN